MQNEILKAARKEWHIAYRETTISMTAYFLSESMKDRIKWHIFQVLKINKKTKTNNNKKRLSTAFLYLAATVLMLAFSQNVFVEILMPSVFVWEGGSFGKLMRLLLYRKGSGELSCLFSNARTKWELGSLYPERGPSPESNHVVRAIILDFQPPEMWEVHFYHQ